MAKKRSKKTLADILYKSSYNILTVLADKKACTLAYKDINPDSNVAKAIAQLKVFNAQKPFLSFTNTPQGELVIKTLTTEQGKTVFKKIYSVGKEVFEYDISNVL